MTNPETTIMKLQDDLRQAADIMTRLLETVGRKGTCNGCGAPIYWIKTNKGNWAPYNVRGENHFIDCPKAKEFKREKHHNDSKGS